MWVCRRRPAFRKMKLPPSSGPICKMCIFSSTEDHTSCMRACVFQYLWSKTIFSTRPQCLRGRWCADHSNTGIVVLNPTRDTQLCVVLCCVAEALNRDNPPSEGPHKLSKQIHNTRSVYDMKSPIRPNTMK
jgi:hypothetical protein